MLHNACEVRHAVISGWLVCRSNRSPAIFSLSDSELGDFGMQRCVATEQPGYPCRVSLTDAAVGEELLLLPYAHQPETLPCRASGPILVRRNAQQRMLEPGVIPDCVTLRLMSVRARLGGSRRVSAAGRG